jgi:hypothetical protein
MDREPAQALTASLDRALGEALALLAFLAARWPELVRSRRGALEAIVRDLAADGQPPRRTTS